MERFWRVFYLLICFFFEHLLICFVMSTRITRLCYASQSLVHTVASDPLIPGDGGADRCRPIMGRSLISELPASRPDNGEHGIVAAALEPSQQVEVNVESIIGNHNAISLC
jgi:hypothetical protein